MLSSALAKGEATLDQKEQSLAARASALAQKEKEYAARASVLDQKEKEYAARASVLDQKEQSLASQAEALAQQAQELETQKQEITAHVTQAGSTERKRSQQLSFPYGYPSHFDSQMQLLHKTQAMAREQAKYIVTLMEQLELVQGTRPAFMHLPSFASYGGDSGDETHFTSNVADRNEE
jgi:uncharacterized protein (DUF3084 family)